jgi:hypothetical protein
MDEREQQMKKRTKAVIGLALIVAGLAVPATASADKVPMSYARDYANNVAIDWSLSDPDLGTFWVDTCWRYSDHKISCDANVEFTHYGDLHCGYYSCWATDTIRTCWKRVYAKLNPHWQRYKVRQSVSAAHCTTTTDTDRF